MSTALASPTIEQLPQDIFIVIMKEFDLQDIYHLSLCSQFFLKLCFNQTTRDFTKFSSKRSIEKPILSRSEFKYKRDENDSDFEKTQEQIWKPMLCWYFPLFETTLNIKNWLHVLRFVDNFTTM